MATPSKAVYYNASRTERRRIADGLAQLREQKEAGEDAARRLRQLDPEWQPWLRHASKETEVLAKALEVGPSVPVRLLACATCGHPTSGCSCVDTEGKPLDWGTVA